MQINELFDNGYTGNIAITGDVVTVKGEKKTVEYTKGAISKNDQGYDQEAAVPAFSYKTDKGRITRSAITEAGLEPLE